MTFSAGETVEPAAELPAGDADRHVGADRLVPAPNIAYVAALGPAAVAQSDRIASEAVSALMGSTAGTLIAAAILISIFSAANGLTLTAPRVYFAMAQDKLFFARLAEVHPRYGTPAFAIVASSAWRFSSQPLAPSNSSSPM